MKSSVLITGSAGAKARFLCAHGAGAAMDSPFLELFSKMLAERAIETIRFEFKYMAARRDGGKRKPPPKAETLMPEYQALIAEIGPALPLVIGGKSMGGRVASLVAAEAYKARQIKGLVCLGYPFHPPNKPESLRTQHLEALPCPALIVQGERDPFGPQAEVESFQLSKAIRFHWAPDGDHDLGPRGASGFTRKGNLASAADAVATFAIALATPK